MYYIKVLRNVKHKFEFFKFLFDAAFKRRKRDLNPRAGLTRPTPLAGAPLEPLEYFSNASLNINNKSSLFSKYIVLYGHVIALSIARCSTIFYLLVQIIAIRIQYNNAREVLHRKFSNCLRSEIFICNYFRIFD